MSRSLVIGILISVLMVPILAQGTERGSGKGATRTGQTDSGSKGQASKKDAAPAGQTGAGENKPAGQSGPGNPGEKTLDAIPRARIVEVASDGSQVVIVETFRYGVAGTLPEPLVRRPGEVVCPQINKDGYVTPDGFDGARPCTGPVAKLYTFEGYDSGQRKIKLAKPGEVLNVPEGALRDRVKEIGVGSIPSLQVEPGGGHRTVRHIGIPRAEISGPRRFWTMFLVFALLVAFAGLVWKGPRRGFHPFTAFLGKDNLYSNSKFQAALWFGVLIVTYVSTLLLRWWNTGLPAGGVAIPTNLLMMSGLSVLTFAGAKAIKQNQVGSANAEAQNAKSKAELEGSAAAAKEAQDKQAVADRLNARDGIPRFWFDLTHNDDGTPSLAKFQLVVIVLIAVGIYTSQVWDFLSAMPLQAKITLPDVDTALLAAFGLGQGAYLGVKFAGDGQ